MNWIYGQHWPQPGLEHERIECENKGVHKANEGLCGEVGSQKFFFLKVDWLIGYGIIVVNRKNGDTWGLLYNNGY